MYRTLITCRSGFKCKTVFIPTTSAALREPHTGLPMSMTDECFVCVSIILSFQNIIVNHGLDSGFPSREENGIGIWLTFTNYFEDIQIIE